MVKLRSIIVAAFALSSMFAVSCSKVPETNSAQAVRQYNSIGVIKAIDASASTVTIDHKEIPGYMSAMEMSFPAASMSVFNGVTVGDQVAFVLERAGNKIALVSMTKIADASPAISGEQLFATNCASCHGAKGEGAKKGIPLISGHALAHSEEEYVQQVVKGEPNKMPGFREKLTDAQIAAIVTYVRTVIQSDVKPEQRAHHDH